MHVSLHRCTYLLFVLVHMSGLTQLESDDEFLFFWIIVWMGFLRHVGVLINLFLGSLGPNTP